MIRKIAIGLAVTLGFLSASYGGETWRKETYDSGESVYYSGYWGGFNTLFLIGERGVGLVYMSANGAYFSRNYCRISIDNQPAEPCEIDFSHGFTFRNSTVMANRLANAKKATLTLKICKGTGPCFFALDGGTLQDISWEWDEPLSTTFPDFKPYPVK